MPKYRKLSKEKWIEFCQKLQYGTTLYVFETNLVGGAIQWGTTKPEDKDGLVPCHVFGYEGKKRGGQEGQCREANGKKVAAKTLINEYMARVMAGDCRLQAYVHTGITDKQEQRIKSYYELNADKPYNMAENLWFAVWGFFNRINYGFGAWISKTFTNPAWKNNGSVVCSQSECIKWKGDPIYDILTSDKPIENYTPEVSHDRIDRIKPYVLLDTETI